MALAKVLWCLRRLLLLLLLLLWLWLLLWLLSMWVFMLNYLNLIRWDFHEGLYHLWILMISMDNWLMGIRYASVNNSLALWSLMYLKLLGLNWLSLGLLLDLNVLPCWSIIQQLNRAILYASLQLRLMLGSINNCCV